MHKAFISALFITSACVCLGGCRSTPPSKPLEMLTPQEQLGRVYFTANCGACHYDREGGSLHGPSMQGVYKRAYLPSGAPANDDRIRNVILHGRGNMPALSGTVNEETLADILAYLKTL